MTSQSLIQIADFLYNFDIIFEHDVPDRLKCIICKRVLKNAKQTSCGCKVCERCINDFLREGERPCPDCDDVKLKLGRDINQDNATNKEIGGLSAKCPFRACATIDVLRNVLPHVEVCDFREVGCSKFSKKYAFKEKEAHDNAECEERVIKCAQCGESMTARARSEVHLNVDSPNLCSKYVGDCPNECGDKNVLLKEHLRSCLNQRLECPFKDLQCKVGKLTPMRLSEHLKAEFVPHLTNLMTEFKELKNENVKLSAETEILKKLLSAQMNVTTSLTESRIKVERSLKEFNAVSIENERLKEEVSILTNMLSEQMNVTTLLTESQIKILVEQFNFVNLENERLKEEVSRLANMLSEQMNVTSLTESRIKVERSVEDLKRRAPGSPSIAEKHVVFRNGSFIWKITDFQSLKSDTESGGRASTTSDPFYTSEFGYKMCLRIYPAGDGVGRGSHLSLFFAIMKGDFDDLLPWPFKQKVTLSLLDQENNGAKNYTETFKPDARSACYQKPIDDCNIASGSPKFIPLSSLTDDSLYCKNDTIYLNISVDTTGIAKP